MKKWIDFRSDTVTQPTGAMRRAMYEAEVGDDVYGDDPTVNRLEALAAEMLGKEAALFVPSGAMGNQVAVMAHTGRGGEVILDVASHIMGSEVAGVAALSGCQVRPLTFQGGMPDAATIRAAIQTPNIHHPETQLICIENALSSGRVVPLDIMRDIYAMAQAAGLPVHVDGARLFNAAAALGADVKELTACCDSVMACLSKGLCAPVGSVVAGRADFIAKARKNRKLLGGGMRQAGILAAAGILALTEMVPLLEKDHENARYLAKLFCAIPGVTLAVSEIDINMAFLRFDYPHEKMTALSEHLLGEGIKINVSGGDVHRFVTNHDTSAADIDRTAKLVRDFLTA